jgi:hypothetical protein
VWQGIVAVFGNAGRGTVGRGKVRFGMARRRLYQRILHVRKGVFMSITPLVTRTAEAQEKEVNYLLWVNSRRFRRVDQAHESRFAGQEPFTYNEYRYDDEEGVVTFNGEQLDIIRKFIRKAYEDGGDHMRSDMLERYGKL